MYVHLNFPKILSKVFIILEVEDREPLNSSCTETTAVNSNGNSKGYYISGPILEGDY